jgi:hypothetical protein
MEQVEYPLDLKFNYGAGDEWNTYGFSPSSNPLAAI